MLSGTIVLKWWDLYIFAFLLPLIYIISKNLSIGLKRTQVIILSRLMGIKFFLGYRTVVPLCAELFGEGQLQTFIQCLSSQIWNSKLRNDIRPLFSNTGEALYSLNFERRDPSELIPRRHNWHSVSGIVWL